MKKNTEYYAVIEGRIDEPTIFTSWYSYRTNILLQRLTDHQ